MVQRLPLCSCLTFLSRSFRTYSKFVISTLISARVLNALPDRSLKKLMNVRVILVSRNLSMFAATFEAFAFLLQIFSMHYTIVFGPTLTRFGPEVETQASVPGTGLLMAIRGLCRVYDLLRLFMSTADSLYS